MGNKEKGEGNETADDEDAEIDNKRGNVEESYKE